MASRSCITSSHRHRGAQAHPISVSIMHDDERRTHTTPLCNTRPSPFVPTNNSQQQTGHHPRSLVDVPLVQPSNDDHFKDRVPGHERHRGSRAFYACLSVLPERSASRALPQWVTLLMTNLSLWFKPDCITRSTEMHLVSNTPSAVH